jgi:chemotaxis protein methyltransferase CheR
MESVFQTFLSDRMFKRFSEFIGAELGTKLPPGKKIMLQARLQKRMRKLHIKTYEQYYDYVFSPEGKRIELNHMLDAVTTNKTDFFREPKHYEVLIQTAVPDLIHRHAAGIRKPLMLWSAGCSSGPEPYTLAMVLSEFAEKQKGFRFSVFASDISMGMLQKAKLAIYEEREAEPIPASLKKKYLLKCRDRKYRSIRIAPEIRRLVTFRRLNFMAEDFALDAMLDIIFCRNVIIYFDRFNQEAVLRRMCRYLRAGGYLFTGHSENLNGFRLPLEQITAAVYKRKVQ